MNRAGAAGAVPLLRDALKSARAVVFDFYNTLVLDGQLPAPVWQHLNALGYRCSAELQAMFEPDAFDGTLTPTSTGDPDHESWMRGNWRLLLRHSGVPEARLERVLATVLEAQNRYTTRPAPKAADLVRLLGRADYRLGLCSNWESDIAGPLQASGLALHEFDGVAISAEVGARKPHLDMFREICGQLGIAPEESIHIGDNWSSDIAGALRASMMPVWLRLGRPSMGLAHLVAEFDSIAQLHDCVSAILGDSG